MEINMYFSNKEKQIMEKVDDIGVNGGGGSGKHRMREGKR